MNSPTTCIMEDIHSTETSTMVSRVMTTTQIMATILNIMGSMAFTLTNTRIRDIKEDTPQKKYTKNLNVMQQGATILQDTTKALILTKPSWKLGLNP